ncbi:hypothetical protein EVA_01773, partial [gut metagenome]
IRIVRNTKKLAFALVRTVRSLSLFTFTTERTVQNTAKCEF